MILVKQRQDLLDEDIAIPFKFGKHKQITEWTRAFQPDELDDQEFNIILVDNSGEVIDIGIAIDFQFKEITEEQS